MKRKEYISLIRRAKEAYTREMMHREYDVWGYTAICKICKREYDIESYNKPGFADHEEVICPKCGARLGSIRADFGYDIIGYWILE